MQRIQASKDRRFLCHSDDSSFFWLGDTAWEIFHRLRREEADEYLSARAQQGFTVIQGVALAEFDGIDEPNAYGDRPLKKNASGAYDPTLPDTDGAYWEYVDWVLERAAHYGLYVALLPTWGDKFNLQWGVGPELFTPRNARAYGKWIGARYASRDNVVWMLGGDRPLVTEEHHLIIRAMAEGIKDGGATQLMTFHPVGGKSSSDFVQDEAWLDMHSFQSGHGEGWHNSWRMVAHDRALLPVRPVINAEPRYEDHPAYFDAASGHVYDEHDARLHIWWDCLSGAAGHTYGNHCIWSMNAEITPYFRYLWREALWHPGAQQMRIAKETLQRYVPARVPFDELLIDQGDTTSHLAACRDGSVALCYSPLGLPFRVRLSAMQGDAVRASLICPRTGKIETLGLFPLEDCTFAPPTQGRGADWTLLLEEYSREKK